MENIEQTNPIKLEQINNDNLGFTRQIVAISEGEEKIPLVDLYATITNNSSNQAINYNLNVVEPKLVKENQQAVQIEVDKFIEDVREKTADMSLIRI